MLRQGVAYLEQHPDEWAPETLPGLGGMSVYDVGLMVRCFYRVGRSFLRREAALRVYRGLDRLYHAQNKDGGWDASLWGGDVSTLVQAWSEVGATSAALRALAETHDARFQAAYRPSTIACRAAGLSRFRIMGRSTPGRNCTSYNSSQPPVNSKKPTSRPPRTSTTVRPRDPSGQRRVCSDRCRARSTDRDRCTELVGTT